MKLQRQSNEQIITLDLISTLGHGGEARVYPVLQHKTLAAKVYHKPTDAHTNKLLAILANPPENPTAKQLHISIAWPVDLLLKVDGSHSVAGFLMPRVKGMQSILEFYNPKARLQKSPFFNYRYLHCTARNLAAAVGALHARGYCIGDVNESNILVSDTALVTLVDTDSFQVRDPDNGVVYRCRVGKPEFTPPELQGKSFHLVDRTPEHDLFGLAVLFFQLLMEGVHPFSGIFQGPGDPPPYEARIAAGHFPYSTMRRVPYLSTPIAPPFEILHPTLQQLFVRCFEDGHNNPLLRPSAQTWQAALNEAENALIVCAVNNQHRYGNHLDACPWCERAHSLGGRDPFPSLEAVRSRQHLQPIEPKRVTPQQKIVPIQTPFLAPIPAHNKFSRFLLSLLGVSMCGLLALLVSFRLLKPAPDISTTPLPTTSDTDPPISTINSSQNSVVYYNQGNSYNQIGNYHRAIENFNRTLRLNPKNAKAYVKRGIAHYELAQHSKDSNRGYKTALKDFNEALKLNPQDAEAYLNRGIVRYKITQHSKEFNSDYWEAVEDLKKAAKLFLEQKDIDNYQQALSNICIVLQNNCDSYLGNPENEKFIFGTQR